MQRIAKTNVSSACSQLLQRAAVFAPLYGPRLANHLPMALVALDRIGATATHLETFFARYSTRLTRRASSQAPAHPSQCLGAHEAFEPVAAWFQQEIEARGHEQVLRDWLPRLFPGVGASAFHALIRLAYALDAHDHADIAVGLAYWTTEYCELGEIGATIAGALDQIASSALPFVAGRELGPGVIVDRILRAAAFVDASKIATQPSSIELRDLAGFALSAYYARDDFTLLHIVTGAHALRIVLEYLRSEDRELALRQFWRAALAAYLSIDRSLPTQSADASPAGHWRECIEAASTSFDDHVAKLTYSVWREAELYGDARYLHLACRTNLSMARAP